MTKIDTYKHLDEDYADYAVKIKFTMPEIAERCCQLNCGGHRLLSALVHALRARQLEYINYVKERDSKLPENKRLNLKPEDERSPLADGIEKLLNEGFDY